MNWTKSVFDSPGNEYRSRPSVEVEDSSYLRNWLMKKSTGKEAEKLQSDRQKKNYEKGV